VIPNFVKLRFIYAQQDETPLPRQMGAGPGEPICDAPLDFPTGWNGLPTLLETFSRLGAEQKSAGEAGA